MIKTNDKELDAVIGTLQAQRNEAMDSLAIMSARLAKQEALTAELQKKIEEANRPKE